ncbi:GPW/gp25 family protein [Methanomethylovorans sp.]|uniref:GPW/gp25 family protein n=1 Tax=Methanomethylovorans sp. TaxID=2758717 RepID=UPI00351C8F0E
MGREFLGVGWKFPLSVDHNGKVAVASFEDDIKEAIWIILGTAKGERVMRPDFGCGINEYVFCSMDTLNLHLIENTVYEALKKWEPRIEVLGVKADLKSAEEGKLLINIDYKVRTTNTQFNMVYPFYIKEGV